MLRIVLEPDPPVRRAVSSGSRRLLSKLRTGAGCLFPAQRALGKSHAPRGPKVIEIPLRAAEGPYPSRRATISLSGGHSTQFNVTARPGEVVVRAVAPEGDQSSPKMDWDFESGGDGIAG